MSFFERIFTRRAEKLNRRLGMFEDDFMEMLNRIDNRVFGMGE